MECGIPRKQLHFYIDPLAFASLENGALIATLVFPFCRTIILKASKVVYKGLIFYLITS